MTIEQEIREAIEARAKPLFLYGLIDMAAESPEMFKKLSETINKVGTQLHKAAELKAGRIRAIRKTKQTVFNRRVRSV